jgi:hypothetical protein
MSSAGRWSGSEGCAARPAAAAATATWGHRRRRASPARTDAQPGWTHDKNRGCGVDLPDANALDNHQQLSPGPGRYRCVEPTKNRFRGGELSTVSPSRWTWQGRHPFVGDVGLRRPGARRHRGFDGADRGVRSCPGLPTRLRRGPRPEPRPGSRRSPGSAGTPPWRRRSVAGRARRSRRGRRARGRRHGRRHDRGSRSLRAHLGGGKPDNGSREESDIGWVPPSVEDRQGFRQRAEVRG